MKREKCERQEKKLDKRVQHQNKLMLLINCHDKEKFTWFEMNPRLVNHFIFYEYFVRRFFFSRSSIFLEISFLMSQTSFWSTAKWNLIGRPFNVMLCERQWPRNRKRQRTKINSKRTLFAWHVNCLNLCEIINQEVLARLLFHVYLPHKWVILKLPVSFRSVVNVDWEMNGKMLVYLTNRWQNHR